MSLVGFGTCPGFKTLLRENFKLWWQRYRKREKGLEKYTNNSTIKETCKKRSLMHRQNLFYWDMFWFFPEFWLLCNLLLATCSRWRWCGWWTGHEIRFSWMPTSWNFGWPREISVARSWNGSPQAMPTFNGLRHLNQWMHWCFFARKSCTM